jgi:hypothetical protein
MPDDCIKGHDASPINFPRQSRMWSKAVKLPRTSRNSPPHQESNPLREQVLLLPLASVHQTREVIEGVGDQVDAACQYIKTLDLPGGTFKEEVTEN